MKGQSPECTKISYQSLTIQFQFLIRWILNNHYKFGLESFNSKEESMLQCKAGCILSLSVGG